MKGGGIKQSKGKGDSGRGLGWVAVVECDTRKRSLSGKVDEVRTPIS